MRKPPTLKSTPAEKPNPYKEMFESARTSATYYIEDAKISVGEKLAKHIVDSGRSRKEVAEQLGLSPARLLKLLRGEADPTLSEIVVIYRAAGEKTVIIGIAESYA